MTRFDIEIQFETDHSVGQGAGTPNHKQAQLVIPGRTLRGAFAAHWWKQPEANAQAFAELFDRDLLVTQATPEDAVLTSAAERVCKYQPEAGCREVTIDLAREALAKAKPAAKCPTCDGPLEVQAGWRATQEETYSRTRSALEQGDNGASTAKDGSLFSRQYRKNRRYHCAVVTDDDLAWLDGAKLWLGGRVSNDTGRAKITVHQAQSADEQPADQGQALILTSPAILCDEFGAATLAVDALLAELCRVSGDELELCGPNWLRSDLVTGWHGRSNLPYPSEWALAAGSTVLVTGLSAAGWQRLGAGIGWRTLDGFGQLKLGAAKQPPPDVAQVWQENTEPLRKFKWSAIKPALTRAIASRIKGTGSADTVVQVDDLNLKHHRGRIEAILALPVDALQELAQRLKSKELK